MGALQIPDMMVMTYDQWLTDCLSCMVFLLRQLFFVAAVVYSGSWDFFLYGRCQQLFVSELNNAFFLQPFILKQCLSD